MPAAEAMAAGNYVVGYHGFGEGSSSTTSTAGRWPAETCSAWPSG